MGARHQLHPSPFVQGPPLASVSLSTPCLTLPSSETAGTSKTMYSLCVPLPCAVLPCRRSGGALASTRCRRRPRRPCWHQYKQGKQPTRHRSRGRGRFRGRQELASHRWTGRQRWQLRLPHCNPRLGSVGGRGSTRCRRPRRRSSSRRQPRRLQPTYQQRGRRRQHLRQQLWKQKQRGAGGRCRECYHVSVGRRLVAEGHVVWVVWWRPSHHRRLAEGEGIQWLLGAGQ